MSILCVLQVPSLSHGAVTMISLSRRVISFDAAALRVVNEQLVAALAEAEAQFPTLVDDSD